MNIKILYDNQAKKGFQCGWGFAALIDNSTLFDTGENAGSLLANLHAFGVEPKQIQQIVLSHEHRDHVGGIAILEQCGPVKVYAPSSFSKRIKEEIVGFNTEADLMEIQDSLKVEPDFIITSQLGTFIKEISLAVHTAKGIILIVGCSHPGLDKIMIRASEFGSIYAVIGGFHGFSKLKALADVSVIVPTHCTQKKQEILDMYPKQTRLVAAGVEMEVCPPRADPPSADRTSGRPAVAGNSTV